jgi:cyclic pyranopterin phosphate synthase
MNEELSFSHVDESGNARMVDIGGKEPTRRTAVASCKVLMRPETLASVLQHRNRKGNVFTVAQIAGITAAKRTGELIPLCHSLAPEHIDVRFEHDASKGMLEIIASVTVTAKTGAEMEALQAASQAALTVYDMCKAADRGMVISELRLLRKEGGASGLWERGERNTG